MRVRITLLLIAVVLAAHIPVLAAEAPVAVSPGEASGLASIESRCPTFHWGDVEGARSYELVVYRLGIDGEEAPPVLSKRIAGSALGWTPSLPQCLERGGQYAWSVRAMGGKEASAWSVPSLFQVASRASESEFQEALEVVRQYLTEEATGDLETSPSRRVQTTDSSPLAPQASEAPVALVAAAGDSALQVNGAAVVTTATFGGAAAAMHRECPGALGSALRYTDCDNGVVRDNNTGLYWLKDASCADLAGTDGSGSGTWATAESAAASLSDGTCGLTDGSAAGDWRQPTIVEFCSAFSGSSLIACPAGAASDSLIDSSVTPTVATGHPFVGIGVPTHFSWSATAHDATLAWAVGLQFGNVATVAKGDLLYVWPVRGSQLP